MLPVAEFEKWVYQIVHGWPNQPTPEAERKLELLREELALKGSQPLLFQLISGSFLSWDMSALLSLLVFFLKHSINKQLPEVKTKEK